MMMIIWTPRTCQVDIGNAAPVGKNGVDDLVLYFVGTTDADTKMVMSIPKIEMVVTQMS